MSTLFDQINYEKAYRENRLNAALWVLERPETLKELLQYGFANDPDISHKANWALEFVCREKLDLLYPYLDYFFEQLPEVTHHGSVRSLSHICELIVIANYKTKDPLLVETFSESHKKTLTECSFDWMISPQKVACQARAMTCLYYLGTEKDWIHPELKSILEANLHQGSAGYQSRGKKILEKIQKARS